MRTVWRRCADCGVYFDKASMHPDPRQRRRFGKPLSVCADCKDEMETQLKSSATPDTRKQCTNVDQANLRPLGTHAFGGYRVR